MVKAEELPITKQDIPMPEVKPSKEPRTPDLKMLDGNNPD